MSDSSAAQGRPKSLGEATGPTGRGEAGGQKPSAATMLGCPRGHGHHDKDARYCSKCGAELRQVTARCTGYCAGTRSVTTLVEDLACPVHGIEAQEAAALVYPDRQAWLDSLAEAT